MVFRHYEYEHTMCSSRIVTQLAGASNGIITQFICELFRFMASEVELNDIIQEMHVIATVPDLYHIVVELNAVQSLLQLISHDNTGDFCSL